jgi:hypothetical protein
MTRRHATKIDAMLRHLAAGADLQDFPGTKFEKLALVRTAGRRGLIAWEATRSRYELTPAGWGELSPRRFGLPSLMVSTALGASIGAAALAFLWLPGVQWPVSARGQANPPVSRLEKPIAAPASPPADAGGRSFAPMQASASQAAPAALAAGAGPSAAPANPIEPAQVAGQPVPEQPSTEAAPTGVKQAVKKSRRKTARRHSKDPAWGFGNPWNARQSTYSRYGQGSWSTYR